MNYMWQHIHCPSAPSKRQTNKKYNKTHQMRMSLGFAWERVGFPLLHVCKKIKKLQHRGKGTFKTDIYPRTELPKHLQRSTARRYAHKWMNYKTLLSFHPITSCTAALSMELFFFFFLNVYICYSRLNMKIF